MKKLALALLIVVLAIMAILMLLVPLALMLVVAGCAAPPPAPPFAAQVAEDTAPAPPVLDRQRFGAAGRYRVIHGRTACAGGARPVVIPDRSSPPAVGVPMRVAWTTAGVIDPQPAEAWLLVSLGDVTPVRLVDVGLPGCWLHVDPGPRNLWAFAAGAVPWLEADGGYVRMLWTPPASFAGLEVNMQLVARAPGVNPAGWMLSPGLEVWIGAGGEL